MGVALAMAWPVSAFATFGGSNGLIAYPGGVTDAGSRTSIFATPPDGAGLPSRLSYGFDSAPVWSADGRSLLFARNVDSRLQIFRSDADGQNAQFVAATGWSQAPRLASFSLSGRRIVFSSPSGIFTIGIDGTERRKVVAGTGLGYPTFLPNGRRIVFSAGVPGYSCAYCDASRSWELGIWSVRTNGSAPEQLTDHSEGPGSQIDSAPDISPDGRRIVFARDRCGRKGPPACAYVMRADGRRERPIGPNLSLPAWSPDGTRLVAVVSESTSLDSCGNLFTMTPKGEDRQRVTSGCDLTAAQAPSWQPAPPP